MPLAMAELCLVLARLVWSFDLLRADTPHGEVAWEDQRVLVVVEKSPFDVRLVAREEVGS